MTFLHYSIKNTNIVIVCLVVLNKKVSIGDFNHTNIVHITKKKCPSGMVEFCPISLCNVIYKIVAKALVN